MKVDQIAIANQFGNRVQQFKTGVMSWLVLAIASLIIGGILIFGIPVGGGWVIRVPFLGTILLLLGPCFLGGLLWTMAMHLVLYEHGLVYKDWLSTKAIPYGDIQSISWEKTSTDQAEQFSPEFIDDSEKFVLYLTNGKHFEVPTVLDQLDMLYTFLTNR